LGAARESARVFDGRFAHPNAAAGVIEAAIALAALARNEVPGIANLIEVDPACPGLPVSAKAQKPASDIALVLCRGFAGTDAALVIRGR
jgi:3-oxoacyl-(acyl-carrier-protein) synthase